MRPSGQAPSVGATFAALSQILIGASAGVSAVLVDYPVGGGQAVRYAAGGAALLLLMRLRGIRHVRVGVRAFALLFLLALMGQTLFNQLLVHSLDHADPATIGSILGCAPVILATLGPLLAKRRPGARIVVGSVLVVAGAVLVEGFGSATPLGLVLALGVLVCELAFSLLAVPLLPGLGPMRVATYATALAVPQSLLTGWLMDGSGILRTPTAEEAAALGYMAAVMTVLAFILWYTALERLGPERAGLFAGLVPIAAAVTAPLFGAGDLRAGQLAGSAVVGLGVVVGMRTTGGRPAEPAPVEAVPHPVPTPARDTARPAVPAARRARPETDAVAP
ncbi:DMT family transporter [Yinghuangia seranimata]|uniref:DMT family transporter n=1 Tax=Yinghuangia seranimata TaxID=408067 RepID=UPI00248BD11E|nr:DMT family transporter [Yinghuangia seranimata]MDI2128871.1 DMT family transporter [Yinghuangia seranimata]